MTDKTKGGGGSKGRPPSRGPRSGETGGGRPPRAGGERPFRARSEDGDRPRRPRPEGGDRPFHKRPEGETGERPFRARGEGSDRPRRPRPEGGDRPFRSRPDAEAGDRPTRKRPGGDRPARARTAEGGERRERTWSPEGERPQRRRPEGGERPFRKREDGDRPFRPRPEGGDRPFRARREEGDRPRPRREDGDRPFRPRRDEGERSGRGREDRGRAAPRIAGGTPRKKEYAERVAKVIARAGLCSRRDAEAWIEEGRVAVNGEVLTSPARDVTKSDTVTVDGTPIPTRERTRLFLYHKPKGIVTTARDPEGRPTVFESLPPGLPRVVTVGRLDINTEGLLLLTNDGGLSRVLELPETGWLRRYRVRAFGAVDQAVLDTLKDGVTIDGMHYGPVEAEIDREKGDNVWLILGLREGKNREVKRILEHLGLQVNRLIRISFGPFQLGDLPEGAAEEVTTRILADQLGPELAARAEADFEAPVFVYDEDDFRPRRREPRERERDIEHRRERFGRGDRDERPSRGRFGGERESRFRRDEPEAEERPRPARRHPTEIVRSTWRAEDIETPPAPKRIPRRGADPKAARAESAGREHVRAGRVKTRAGREVLVEKVARDPGLAPPREERRERWPEREERAPRRRSAWSEGGGERAERPARPPRRREETGEGRAPRPFGDRPRPPRRDDDRPRPQGRSFRPREDREGGEDRPRGPRREGGGERPFRPKGPPKGPPRSGGRPGGGPSRGPGGPRRPRRDD